MAPLPAVDWTGAARFGSRHVAAGPTTSEQERRELVASVRELSVHAHRYAVELSRLPDPGTALVAEPVSRQAWVQANIASARQLLGDRLASPGANPLRRGQAKANGVQLGLGMALFANRILGQFDPIATTPALYIVAPNIIDAERELHVDPSDFRLWVLIHEQTHRLQFAHAGWIPDYMRQLISEVLARLDDSGEIALDEVTAFMSVMEGYAETMMNRVGPQVIASLPVLKESFAKRRQQSLANPLLRKVFGYGAKQAQYREGAAFCDAVIWRCGIDGLNQVWQSPAAMPTLAELARPDAWITRVLG